MPKQPTIHVGGGPEEATEISRSPQDPEVSGRSMRPVPFGKYTLVKKLGVGGMAEAFLAQTQGASGFQKTSVVKRMLPHIADDAQFVRMFHAEARVAALLTHTNIVQIYELGEIDGAHFISMEYVDGAPLHQLARTAWQKQRSVPMEVLCCAMADAALGLAAAHELCDSDGKPLGVIHRDISPDNLMINREGVTKILDFGVAKLTGSEKTAAGELRGKIPFLAPEQLFGRKIDSRTDLYALGVTFYWLVTGKRPFSADGDHALMHAIVKEVPRPPSDLNPQIPERVNDLILQLLAKDADDRPRDGYAVHDLLADALVSRRSIVVPFVREMLAGALSETSDGGVHTPGFVPSTPHTAALRSWRRHVAPTRDLDDATMAGTAIASAARGQALDVDVDVEVDPEGATVIREVDTTPVPSEFLAAAVRAERSAAALAEPATAELPGPFAQALTEPGHTVVDSVEQVRSQDVRSQDVLGDPSTMLELSPVDIGDSDGDSDGDNAIAAPARTRSRTTMAAAIVAIVAIVAVGAIALTREPAPLALGGDGEPVPVTSEPVQVEPVKVEPVKVAPVKVAPVKVAPVREPKVAPPKGVEPPLKPAVTVQGRAPAGIQWQIGGKTIGVGATALKVAADAKTVTAFDATRGGRWVVRIVDGVADFDALPHGKIHPRASPYAEVFLGRESLGTTPFAAVDVVAGKYTLRFVHGGKEEKRTVDVIGGETARVNVDFGG